MLAIFLTSSVFASASNDPVPLKNSLREEIRSHIVNINLGDVKSYDKHLKIQFMINDKNELVVLRTNNEDLDEVIKRNLNYKMIKTQDVNRNTVYSIKVNITD